MPLHLKIRPNERFIVNGCVIRNGDRQANLVVENQADILRSKEIVSQGNATTPGLQAQHLIQICIAEKSLREDLLPIILHLIDNIEQILRPKFTDLFAQVKGHLDNSEYYRAFRELSAVSEYEALVLSLTEESSSTKSRAKT